MTEEPYSVGLNSGTSRQVTIQNGKPNSNTDRHHYERNSLNHELPKIVSVLLDDTESKS